MTDNKPYEGTEPALHTLESDLASAVRDDNYGRNIIKIVTDPTKNSLTQTNVEEEQAPKGPSVFTKRNILIATMLLFVISSGLVIAYILYQAKNVVVDEGVEVVATTTAAVSTTTEPVIVNTDFLYPEIMQTSNFNKLDRAGIVTEMIKIKQLLRDKSVKANNNIGINTGVDVVTFFEKIRYSGDEALLRSLSNVYAFGIYTNEKNEFEEYLLIKVDNFDLTFKSILDWEKYMPVDLKNIFVGNNEIITIATTTVATTTSTTTVKTYTKKETVGFIDRTLKNYDIREYVNNTNNINLIYGFLNNRFLLITSGESSFIDIKNRLLKENIIR